MIKSLLVAGLVCLTGCSAAYAVEVSGGIGAVVPDNENVESAVIGKVDAGFGIGQYLSLGVSVSQTGNFKQNDKPKEVTFAEANPQAFAGKSYHPHEGDVIIIDNSDVTTIVNVLPANDPLPNRPTDATERSFWASEAYFEAGVPLKAIRPYFRAFMGASGVRSYDGESRIGLSKGLGGGISFNLLGFNLAIEAMRRHIETNVNTYGSWQYMAKAGVKF